MNSLRKFINILATMIILVALVFPAYGKTKDESSPPSHKLYEAFIEGLKPEKMELILNHEPDEKGKVGHLYLDLTGCDIGGVRIDHLTIEAVDVEFTPPSTWSTEQPDVKNMLDIKAKATILEEDVNKALLSEEFGDDDGHWHDLLLDFRNGGLYVRGYYLTKFLFRLDILIELEGRFEIRRGKELWLADYVMRVNKVDLPKSITDRAISQIQPVIDLKEFVFPLVLDKVEQKDDRVVLASRILPKPFEGIRYTYEKPQQPD